MWATEILRVPAAAALWAAATLALAQPAAGTAAAPRAVEGQPVITDEDIQRARDRYRAPSDEEVRRLTPRATPRIDKLPQPAGRGSIDLEALSRGFQAQTDGRTPLAPAGPALLVFISFALPDETLRALAAQAGRAQATLVLRGLIDGSLVRTAARVREVLGSQAAVQIDPQAFDRYAVAKAPSFVLAIAGAATPCTSSACQDINSYALVAGDVSLDYALRHIQRSAPKFAMDANTYLKRLGR